MKVYYWCPYITDYSTGICVVIAPDDDAAFKLLTEKRIDGVTCYEWTDDGKVDDYHESPHQGMIRRSDLAIYDEPEKDSDGWVKPVITEITPDTRLVYEVSGGA